MNWLGFAILTIIFYALFNFFLKLSSERIHAGLGGFIISLISSVVLLVFLGFTKLIRGEEFFSSTKPGGILYSLLAGLFVGIATIVNIKMYSMRVSLSVGVPLTSIGTVFLVSLIGILILKEGITARYVVGFTLSLLGLYILITK